MPMQIVDQLLPMVASGDAGTRTTVVKILMGMGDPGPVIRRYLEFSKTLAGKEPFELTDLPELLKEIKHDLAASLEEKHAIIEAPDLPVINAIPFQIKQ